MNAASLTTPLRQAYPDVYTDLRRRIVSLDLPPGGLLSRSGLQEHYRVSSTPVRDALLRLQEEGLVEIYPQSRTLVSRIDLEQARQAQFLRCAVEQKVAHHLAADPPEHLVATLSHVVELQEERAAERDLAAFSALDRSFHRALFDAAGLLGLHGVLRRECTHIDRLRALHLPLKDKVAQILVDHRGIVAAIARRAPADARDVMATHLSQSIAMGDAIRAKHPDYFRS